MRGRCRKPIVCWGKMLGTGGSCGEKAEDGSFCGRKMLEMGQISRKTGKTGRSCRKDAGNVPEKGWKWVGCAGNGGTLGGSRGGSSPPLRLSPLVPSWEGRGAQWGETRAKRGRNGGDIRRKWGRCLGGFLPDAPQAPWEPPGVQATSPTTFPAPNVLLVATRGLRCLGAHPAPHGDVGALPAPHGDGSSHKTWVFGCPYCDIGDTSLSSGCLTVAGRTGHDSPQRQPVMGGHPMTGDRTGVAVTPWHQWQRGSGTRQPPNHRLAPQTTSSPTKSLPPPLWAEARGCSWHGTAVMGLPRLDAGVPS